jgi:hypothetical protein
MDIERESVTGGRDKGKKRTEKKEVRRIGLQKD